MTLGRDACFEAEDVRVPGDSVPSVVLGLPAIVREPGSVLSSSFRRAVGDVVDIDEGCVLTKSVKYTHRLVHRVNAVWDGDSSAVVSTKFI